MKKRYRVSIIIITAAILAGVTFKLNKSYIEKNTKFSKVAVAKGNVIPFSKLTEYEFKEVVKSALPEDAITEEKYLKDKEFYAGEIGLAAGDIIRTTKLVDRNNNYFGLALGLPEKKVLIGVKTDQILSAGRNLKPGVVTQGIVYIAGDGRSVGDRVITAAKDPLLKDLLIKEVQNSEATDATSKEKQGREAIPTVAIIETSLHVAQRLVYYQEIGKVYLAPSGISTDEYFKENSQLKK